MMEKINFILKSVICAVLLFFVPLSSTCLADYDYISIREPFMNKIPMAVPVFKSLSETPRERQVASDASDMMQAALEFTRYFRMIDRGAFLEQPAQKGITAEAIDFKNWTDIGAELLITGGIRIEGEVIQTEFRLFDPFRGQLLIGKRYTGQVSGKRNMVLRFCAEVIERLTGKRGLFESRIAFVGTGSDGKAVYICDFDGSNLERKGESQSIVLSPAWSPDSRSIAHTAYINGRPEIFILDLQRNNLKKAVAYDGINITPTWLPGQFRLAATLSFEGDEEIYLLTEGGKVDKRLTRSWGVDVSPTFSPDGKQMAFVSNRSGSPQIYIHNLKTGGLRRLTYEGDYNTQPDWSPAGDKIVYSGMGQGSIDIFVIDAESGEVTQLTRDAGDNEAPSWSPDGSLIVFSSTRKGPSRLFVMTASGTDQRMLLEMPGKQTMPDWSPPLMD